MGEVLILLKLLKISLRGGKWGTGSLLPGTVALDAKRSLNKLLLVWASFMISLFSIIGGIKENFFYFSLIL